MELHSKILVYVIVALSAVCRLDAYPVHPDIEGMQDLMPTDFNLLDNNVGFIPDDTSSAGVRQSRNLNSALNALEEGINQIQKSGRWNGGKESFQDDASDNLVDDIKTLLWKLAAADKLRSQTFVKADQSPQKPSKRACFWKYCVTN